MMFPIFRRSLLAATLLNIITFALAKDPETKPVMWGFTPSRSLVSLEKNPPIGWNCETGKNIKWIADLGACSYGTPVISHGIVWVGSDNDGKNSDKKYSSRSAALMAFRESDGKFLWQRSGEPLLSFIRQNESDYISSAPAIEGDFLYYLTNRCELVCLDITPLANGTGTPKEIWALDFKEKLDVAPHEISRSSPVIWGDNIYVITGNGVDETHKHVPKPKAPALVCANKKTGNVVWTSNAPGDQILNSQCSSPAIAHVKDRTLVIAPLGDAWVYAFDAKDGTVIWKFDANLKNTVYPITKNEIIATPAIVEDRMYLAIGQAPEHGEGPGRLWCVDITKTGDVSAELLTEDQRPDPDIEPVEYAMAAKQGKPNPNSAVLWTFAAAKDVAKPKPIDRMNRSTSTVAVSNGLVFAADLSGILHCFNADTGEQYWSHDVKAQIQSSPLIADGKLFLTTEAGTVKIFAATKEKKLVAEQVIKEKLENSEFDTAILYGTPTLANGTLYLMSRNQLFAIGGK